MTIWTLQFLYFVSFNIPLLVQNMYKCTVNDTALSYCFTDEWILAYQESISCGCWINIYDKGDLPTIIRMKILPVKTQSNHTGSDTNMTVVSHHHWALSFWQCYLCSDVIMIPKYQACLQLSAEILKNWTRNK